MTVTEQKELAYSTTGGAGTYQVDTSNLPLDADGNLTTPGIYNVTYIYQINDQDTVTATAQVIVQAVKMITRTIHYVDGDDNNQAVANDVTQTLTFYGTPTDAAGTVFTWEAVNGDTFASVDSPAVANMTPDTATVAALAVDENTADSEVTVTYHADPVTPDTPSTPDTPTTPDRTSTPVTPAAPSQPTAVQPAVPVNTSNKTAVDTTTGQKTLPQTGNQESAGIPAVFGLGLSSLALSFTGLFKKRHN